MGYSNRELTPDFQEMSSGDFVGVATQEFTLDELKMNEEEPAGGTSIRWMLPSGAFQKAYWGWEYDPGIDDFTGEIGWVNDDGIIQHYTFKPGEGFFMTPGDVEDPKLLSSGALYTSDASIARVGVSLTPDFQEITSNPMPTGTFTLDDIQMNEEEPTGGTSLRWMLSSGAFQKAYWGWEYDPGIDDFTGEIGWVNDDGIIQHYTFKAGESFFVQPGDVENPVISFPNPLFKAN